MKLRILKVLKPVLMSICITVILALSGYTVLPAYGEKTGQNVKIALLPFDNFSVHHEALFDVMPVVTSRLEEEGFEVVDYNDMLTFLCKERVRATGYVSKDLALGIGEEFKLQYILVGSIVSFKTGKNPQFGLTARLVDSSNGSILWADYASATGEDFTKILGLGKIKSIQPLILKVVDSLFDSFTTNPPYKDIESTYKVAVMPLQNKSESRNSGMIAMNLFLVELFQNKRLIPVEYGNVRQALVENTVMYRGELDYKNIKNLSQQLGVDIILVGTVERYFEGRDVTSPPDVTITARLLDVRNNRIFWFESARMNGDDGIIVFDWGKIWSVDGVAHKVVSNLIDDMETEQWL
jgi:TolB-like protein